MWFEPIIWGLLVNAAKWSWGKTGICCSVAKSCLTPCDSIDTRLPCPALSPRVCSSSCSLSGDVIQPSHPLSPCSACPQSFPASGSSNQSILKEINPEYSWKDWCWSWNSFTLATWCKEPTHWKRPWCWERLKTGGEGDNRGWDDWMALPTQWTWVWANSRRWWRTGKPGMLQSMGFQRVRHDWVTEQQEYTYQWSL